MKYHQNHTNIKIYNWELIRRKTLIYVEKPGGFIEKTLSKYMMCLYNLFYEGYAHTITLKF